MVLVEYIKPMWYVRTSVAAVYPSFSFLLKISGPELNYYMYILKFYQLNSSNDGIRFFKISVYYVYQTHSLMNSFA